MKQSAFPMSLIAILISALPFLYVAVVWNQLPDVIPLHFGADGQPDRLGPKSEILIPLGLVGGAGLLSWFILTNLHKIDPKKTAHLAAHQSGKFALGVVMFTALMGFFIIYSTVHKGSNINFLFVGMGLFFAWIGNSMHSLKPNYFIGLRLPWTLENDTNWMRTHQMASKVWVAGGLLMSIGSIIIPPAQIMFLVMPLILAMVIIPAIFSYRFYKKGNPEI